MKPSHLLMALAVIALRTSEAAAQTNTASRIDGTIVGQAPYALPAYDELPGS